MRITGRHCEDPASLLVGDEAITTSPVGSFEIATALRASQ